MPIGPSLSSFHHISHAVWDLKIILFFTAFTDSLPLFPLNTFLNILALAALDVAQSWRLLLIFYLVEGFANKAVTLSEGAGGVQAEPTLR